MRIDVVTIFPELVRELHRHGVVGRAIEQGRCALHTWNPRDLATDRHRTVDDRPFGGGPGMVMKVEPLRSAVRAAAASAPEGARTIFLTPQGRQLTQRHVGELAGLPGMILVAGRYEGIDERAIGELAQEELSIGDFVLSGGELAAAVVIDAVVRLLPGVLGHPESAAQDSFSEGLLDCPHYTRPEVLDGARVPDVLLGGDHAMIRRWRLKQSLGRTWRRRPDLLARLSLTGEQRELLAEFIAEEPEGSGGA